MQPINYLPPTIPTKPYAYPEAFNRQINLAPRITGNDANGSQARWPSTSTSPPQLSNVYSRQPLMMPSPLGPAGLTNFAKPGEPARPNGHRIGCQCCKCRGRCKNWMLDD
eukprot:Gregarina_sp_Poly_1__1930@NODE_1504_length_3979_cov_42_233129_g996_i0_p3_GENE_NODE_1504_length_3979_cov_42_233129_g996_i0NODE_1504_length_3979_cov_42_233129_g996_i0_p3_ORF_typecomplete_len110_score3_79_NODE_1504_length_3979_cov_42_233129_g996_i035733902